MTPYQTDVLIVGAGLAGLSCALTLSHHGISNLILEADEDVGGRARTDQVDGFLLDRGFQVFPTAYPEAKRVFDYEALKLHKFYPGALVRFGGKFHRVADPFRNPHHAIQSLMNPIGTLRDKIQVAKWRKRVLGSSVQDLLERPETPTINYLEMMGFSPAIIDHFFRPFLGGVFMDSELRTSSRLADFVFRMFAEGDTVLPENGIEALARQLASNLQSDQIRTGQKVAKIDGTTLTLESGEILQAKQVVIATEGPAAQELSPLIEVRPWHETTCIYFRAVESPISGPYLTLNGERSGIINSCTVLTEVAPSYAPPGQHLISVTTRENQGSKQTQIEKKVQAELTEWFGIQAKDWQHLRTYRISQAQPDQTPPSRFLKTSDVKIREGLYICGDYCATATFDGAIGSGRQTAEEILRELAA